MSKGIQFLLKKNKITVISGNGSLMSSNTVNVTDKDGKVTNYEAKHIILATGGRAKALPNVPIDGDKVIEYRKAMTLPVQPKRMVVIGGGAIGVEFAYFYHTIGTEVTLVEFLEQGMLPREDAEVSKEITKIYSKKGIKVLGNTSVESVDTKGKEVIVKVKDRKTGNISEIRCDIVLSAAGVTPNTENLGLEKVGVKVERGLVS